MASNTFGNILQFSTWGESHGVAIGGVVDGVPPLIPLVEEDIQYYLDKRKPGQSRFTTQRKEPDKIKIVEALWSIIYSDKDADLYETNLMRRLAGLLYIDSKVMGDIKNKIKNENLK